jgi:hypothetical protein
VSQDLSRRHFLVSAATGAASLAFAGMPSEGVFESYALSEWRLFGLNAGLIQSS